MFIFRHRIAGKIEDMANVENKTLELLTKLKYFGDDNNKSELNSLQFIAEYLAFTFSIDKSHH
jgi:hypothetical protein